MLQFLAVSSVFSKDRRNGILQKTGAKGEFKRYAFLLIQNLVRLRLRMYSFRGQGLVVQTVKNPSAMLQIWIQFLGWEDPLEKEMATHYWILAWKIPWTEEPGGLQSMGSQRVGHN